MATKPRVFVCVNQRLDGDVSCGERGSKALAEKLEQLANGAVEVRRRKCLGLCEYGPNMRRDGVGIFIRVTEADLPGIIDGSKPSNLDTVDGPLTRTDE
ncbi:MAG: (2Fe-2S) ferredoxin domain-containing protein [Burkholderiales bacterium]